MYDEIHAIILIKKSHHIVKQLLISKNEQTHPTNK